MELYLGIDGGGAKTEAVLIDSTGRVVAQTRGKASNPLRSSLARAFTALDDAAARALAEAQAEATDVRSVTAGLAGAGQPRIAHRFVSFLSTRFREAAVEAITDLEIALETIVEEGPAVALVSGTGSAAFGRNNEGRTTRAGGWGPWFSDEGSAFDIGRRTLAAIARRHDEELPSADFEPTIHSKLGLRDWRHLIDRAARKPLDILPAVFPVTAAAAESGSEAARAILCEAAESLAALAGIVVRNLGLQETEFAVGRVGGVFGHAAYFDDRVDQSLAALAPGAKLTPPRYSPAIAAACRALRRAGNAAVGHAGDP